MKTTVIHHSAGFGFWTVIEGQRVVAQKTEWFCLCKCGNKRWVRANNLKSGISTNCGCIRKTTLVERNKLRTGGLWVQHRRAAYTWDRMLRRCNDQKAKGFDNYGGRGIIVGERGSGCDGLENFILDMGDPPEGTSLGRKDNDLGYSPTNCRWETPEQQQSNTRRNVFDCCCSGVSHL